MNAWINYIIEANIGLLLLLAAYKLLLSNETNFRIIRSMLLIGVTSAITFPLLHFEVADAARPLSIGSVLPPYWLPEVMIGDEIPHQAARSTVGFWTYTSAIYVSGLLLFFTLVVIQLTKLLRVIRKARTYRVQRLRIAESVENKPIFSFFSFIFIGKAHELSVQDKRQIILHESVHAEQWHSLDILLINVLKVIFWFNPFINTYKKIFIQLHEFEADARAVENSDVNKYCSLLARIALASAGFRLANHFNNSLTVKRLEMMRTIKNKLHPWKIAAMALMIPASFFFLACQDQVSNTVSDDIVMAVDEHAYPEGGLQSFYNQVKINLRYPQSARADHKYGKVLVQFVVNEDGTLSNLEVLDSPDPALDEEVMRVLSNAPKWVPAKRHKASVKEQMVLPVNFILDFPGKSAEEPGNTVEIATKQPSLPEIAVVGYAN